MMWWYFGKDWWKLKSSECAANKMSLDERKEILVITHLASRRVYKLYFWVAGFQDPRIQ